MPRRKPSGRLKIKANAAVAKQADARDLKSLGVTSVPVQIRPAAPLKKDRFFTCLFRYTLNFSNSVRAKSNEVCVYIARVVFNVLCPTSVCVTFTCIPLSAQRVIKVCRKSCSLWFGQTCLNKCVRASALYGKTNTSPACRSRCCAIIFSSSSVSIMYRSEVSVFVPFIFMSLSACSTSVNLRLISSPRRTPVNKLYAI